MTLDQLGPLLGIPTAFIGITFSLADINRTMRVKGSVGWHRANALVSWLRPLVRPLYAANAVVHIAIAAKSGPFDLGIEVLWQAFLVWIFWGISGRGKDDDDDPWGDLGRKIMRRVQPPVTAAAGATV